MWWEARIFLEACFHMQGISSNHRQAYASETRIHLQLSGSMRSINLSWKDLKDLVNHKKNHQPPGQGQTYSVCRCISIAAKAALQCGSSDQS